MASPASTNRGPKIELQRKRVFLHEISVVRPASGWRDVDPERVSQIKNMCYGGQFFMNVFGGVMLLAGASGPETDAQGNQLVDDGLSTVIAWKEMSAEYDADSDTSPTGEPWDPAVLDVFIRGLTVSECTYEDNSDVALREAWNAAKHDEENNKYRPTSLAKKIEIVMNQYRKDNDWTAVTSYFVSIYGKSKYSTVQRWVRIVAPPGTGCRWYVIGSFPCALGLLLLWLVGSFHCALGPLL